MSNSVFNITWDANATQRGLDKAANRVASAVEKTTNKLASDMRRNTSQVTAAINTGAKNVTDAVKRIATNNAEQSNTRTSSASALHRSLKTIAAATLDVAERTRTHPTEVPAALESAKSIAKQFTDLTERASRYADEGRQFHKTAENVQRTAVLFAKQPSQCEVYNDIYSDVVNLYRVLRDLHQFKQLFQSIEGSPYSREDYNDSCRALEDDPISAVERARCFFVSVRQSFSSLMNSWSTPSECSHTVASVSYWRAIGGHSGFAGQIPGLNFGTVAPPPSVQPTQATSPPSGSVFCTNCGNSVSEQAVACMSCGAKPVGHKKFCRYCGTALNPEQVVCLECGKAIEKAGIRVVAFRSPRDMGRAFREVTAKAKKQPSLVLVSIGIGGLSSVLLHFFTAPLWLWLIPVFGIVALTGILVRFPSEN